MGWTNPWVQGGLAAGIILLIAFVFIEMRVKDPMFRLSLFRIRMFAAGNVSGFLYSVARGGLMFMLIIWLQGIWLPLHGYNFVDTPLWAGIYMTPMMGGFFLMGPLSGWLSDRFGSRGFATGGMLLTDGRFSAAGGAAGQLFLPAVHADPGAFRPGHGHVRLPQQ